MRFKPSGRPTKTFKQLCQEYEVPPWMRNNIPLIYLESEMLGFADYFISDSQFCESGENLFRIIWQKSDLHCGL